MEGELTAMATSDERREVSARLREEGRVLAKLGEGSETASLTLDDVLGVSHDGTWEDQFDRLADLIEPQKEGMCCDASDEGNVFECSRCGCVVRLRTGQADAFENVTYGPTLTMPNGRGGKLSFCPHCGARVTSEGEG